MKTVKTLETMDREGLQSGGYIVFKLFTMF